MEEDRLFRLRCYFIDLHENVNSNILTFVSSSTALSTFLNLSDIDDFNCNILRSTKKLSKTTIRTFNNITDLVMIEDFK